MNHNHFVPGIILCLIISSTVYAQTFSPKYNSGINPNVTGYYEYLPAGYTLPANANKKYPVIFYFHGAGELGNVSSNNLEKLKQSAIPRIITAGKFPNSFTVNNETFSYIVICPQFISSPINPSEVDAVINYILSQPSVYRIDAGKVYLTGFSLGGKTTWEYMMASLTNARKIAAAIPIATYCYPIPNMNLMQNVAQAGIAVWALHNTNDLAALPSQCATDYMNKLNSYNPVIPGKLTIACVPGGNAPCGHDSSSWNTIYTASNYTLPNTGLNIYQWLYTFRQNAAGVPPNANAGADAAIAMPNTITLNGNGSTDPDGNITSYFWRKISGPSSFSINNASIVNPTLSSLVAGTYIIELKVTDSQSFTDLDSVRIVVTNPNANQLPSANAGNDITVTLPTNWATLNGSGTDADGSIESYFWEKVTGPAQYSISNASIASPVVSNLTTGTYWFKLTLTDNQGGTGTDMVQIQVINTNRNLPPVAKAGPDQNINIPQNTVTLNGSGSSDPDGTITNYNWSKISGPASFTITNANSVSTTITNLVEGVYWFQLAVTDDSSAVGKDTVVITVSSVQRVLIDAGQSTLLTNSPDQWGKYWNNMTDGRPGLRINNAVSISNVPTTIKLEVINRIDGTAATYNPGSSSSGTVGDIGEYPASSTNDNIFAHESATNGKWRLYDLDPLRTYTIKFWGCRIATGNRIIQIKRSDESVWQEFNTANNSNYNTAATFSFSGKSEMSFDIMVKTGSVFSYINVLDITMTAGSSNLPPVSKAGPDRTIVLPKDSVKLNGSGSFDPEGTVLQYKWRKISGPLQSNFSSDAIANPDFMNLSAGTYDIELKVTDNGGLIGLDTVRVIVTNAVTNAPPVARGGTDQIISHPLDSIIVNGSTSIDTDGSITGYKWTKISGPSSFLISNDVAANTTIKNLAAGTYSFELTVTDNQNAQGKDTIIVTVNLMPTPPPTNTDVVSCPRTFKIVVLGSSTSYGTGASPIDSSWVNKFHSYVRSRNVQNEVINLSMSSFTTYHVLCPNNFIPPANRPAPDTARNITKALSLNPDAIIINLPSNDVGLGYSVTEQKNNYEQTMMLANSRNIPVWVTTTQPRNTFSPSERDSLKVLRDWTYLRFGSRAIDFWTTVADSVGKINSLYNSGDGVHVNNYGHHIFYSRTAQEKILDELCTQQPPANQPPVSNAGSDASITLPLNSITLTGSNSYDPDGSITTYSWSKISGPASFNFNNTALANPTVSNLIQGVYNFRLVVTDNNNTVDDDTVTINVNPAPVTSNQRVLIDVGQSTALTTSPDQWGKYWNNMTDARPGMRITNAITTINGSTGIKLEVINRIDGTAAVYNSGTSASGAVPIVGDYPVSATTDNAFAHESTTTGQWRISGLDPSLTYSIKFWGSRVTSGVRILQIKRFDESIWQEYNGVNNTDFNTGSTFTFSGKTEMLFDIRVKPGSVMAYINVIDINITIPGASRTMEPLIERSIQNEGQVRIQNSKAEIFPNPTDQSIFFKLQNQYKGRINISVSDQFGRMVKYFQVNKQAEVFTYEANIPDIPAGIYYMQIRMGGKIQTFRVIKISGNR